MTAPTPPPTRLVLLAFGLVALTAWLCAAPILERPQLDPDDARYVQIARGVGSGEAEPRSGLRSLVVENRWDHLWWIDVDRVVRFFRPAVVTSYALDDALAPGSLARQMMLTNLLLHLATGLLFVALCLRWLPPAPAILTGCLFTAFAAHGENLWFVAGRTGSLAGLAVIGTVSLHVQRTTASRIAAPLAFGLGLLAKETAAVAPALCLVADVLVERRGTLLEMLKRDRLLYLGYGTVLALYAALRTAAIGGGVALSKPYLISPFDPEFPAHLAGQAISYSQNLAVGTESPPFADLPQVLDRAGAAAWFGAALLVALLAVAVRSSRLGRFGALWIALTWLPASIAYLSERYLYLPAAGLALAAGAATARCRTPRMRVIALGLLALWTIHQGWMLHTRNHHHGVERHRELTRIAHTVAPLRDRIPRGSTLWLVNLPGTWIAAQFAEPSLQWVLDDPELRVRVLTPIPAVPLLGRPVQAAFEPDGALRVWADLGPVMLDHPPGQPWRSVETGAEIPTRRTGLEVEVLDGGLQGARALRFRPTNPEEQPLVLIWRADPDQDQRLDQRLQDATVDLLTR